VGEIALPLHSVPTAAPHEPLGALIDRLAAAGHGSRALIIDGGKVVGIVTPSDLARLIDVYRLAHPGLGLTAHRQDGDNYSGAGDPASDRDRPLARQTLGEEHGR
jgi:hypothetical protein